MGRSEGSHRGCAQRGSGSLQQHTGRVLPGGGGLLGGPILPQLMSPEPGRLHSEPSPGCRASGEGAGAKPSTSRVFPGGSCRCCLPGVCCSEGGGGRLTKLADEKELLRAGLPPCPELPAPPDNGGAAGGGTAWGGGRLLQWKSWPESAREPPFTGSHSHEGWGRLPGIRSPCGEPGSRGSSCLDRPPPPPSPLGPASPLTVVPLAGLCFLWGHLCTWPNPALPPTVQLALQDFCSVLVPSVQEPPPPLPAPGLGGREALRQAHQLTAGPVHPSQGLQAGGLWQPLGETCPQPEPDCWGPPHGSCKLPTAPGQAAPSTGSLPTGGLASSSRTTEDKSRCLLAGAHPAGRVGWRGLLQHTQPG